jgi:ComEC/Rec2-related protein
MPAVQLALPARSEGVNPLFGAVLPSLALFLSLASASLLGYSGSSAVDRSLSYSLCACAGGIIIAAVLRYNERMIARIVRLMFCFGLCFAAYLFAFHSSKNLMHKPDVSAWGKELSAEIISSDESRYSQRLILLCTPLRDTAAEPVKVVSYASKERTYYAGESLVIQDALESASDNAFLDQFARQGIHYTIRLTKNNSTVVQKVSPSLRTRIRRSIIARNYSLYGEQCGGVINALWLGDGYFVDKKTNYDFMRAGLLHILAASGTHVAIVAGIPLFLLSLFGIRRKQSMLIVSGILAVYLYITCAPVSLVRACIMFWMYAFVYVINRERSALNMLFLSGSVILFLYPYEVYSLGFQLSFCATGGLILYYSYYKKILPRLPLKINESFALTLSAQLFVIPILAITLGQVNCTGILANLIIVPGTSLAMAASFIPHCIDLVHGGTAHTVALAVTRCVELNLYLAEKFAQCDGHFVLSPFPVWTAIPYMILCLPPILTLQSSTKGLALTAGTLCITLILLQGMNHQTYAEPQLLAEGRHSICFEDHRAIIRGGINAGEQEQAEQILRQYGYCIPEIVLTDVSEDSLNGTARFLRRNHVARISLSKKISISRGLRFLVESAAADGIPIDFEGDSS